MQIELKDKTANDYHIILDLEPNYKTPDNRLILKSQYNLHTGPYRFEEKCIHIDGVYIYFCKRNFKENRLVEVFSTAAYIQMHFELDGGFTYYKPHSPYECDILTNAGEFTLFYVPNLDGILHYPVCEDAFSVEIEFSEKWLTQYFGEKLELFTEFAEHIREQKMAIFRNMNFPITAEVSKVLHKLYQCPIEGDIQKIYLESKLLELISLMLHMAEAKPAKRRKNIADKDRLSLNSIKALIEEDVSISYSIEQLSFIAGMNRTKLQALFQKLHGKTIHEFVIETRMNLAYKIISKEGNNIKIQEVANRVGYRKYNHFSMAFKKYFGKSPGKI